MWTTSGSTPALRSRRPHSFSPLVQLGCCPYLRGSGSRVPHLPVPLAFLRALGTCSVNTICSGARASAAKYARWQEGHRRCNEGVQDSEARGLQLPAGHPWEPHSYTERKGRLGQPRGKLCRALEHSLAHGLPWSRHLSL